MGKAKPKYQMTKNKYLLPPEFADLQVNLQKHAASDYRDTTLIWFMMHTGARAQEALNVKRADLDSHGQTVMIKGLKGSDDRELPLPPWLFARIWSLAVGEEPLFRISYKRLYQIWDLYRPVKKSPKALRHTFAIMLYESTKDVRLVKHALGHRSITNTLVYIDYLYSQKELRKKMPDWGGPEKEAV